MDFSVCAKGHEYPSYKDACSVCWADEVSHRADSYPGWILDPTSPPGIIIGECAKCKIATEPGSENKCRNCSWDDQYKGCKYAEMPDGGLIVICKAGHAIRGEKYELYDGCPLCAADCKLGQSYIFGEHNYPVVANSIGKIWPDNSPKEYIRALRILSAAGLVNQYALYKYQVDMFIGSPSKNIWLIIDTYSLPMEGMRAWSLHDKSPMIILSQICKELGIDYDAALEKYKRSKKDRHIDLKDCHARDMITNLESLYRPNRNHDFLARLESY